MHYTNFISSLFEKFASYAFSPMIQRWINRTYVKIFDIKLDEFDTLESYPTLNALFTRSLVKIRSFDKTDSNMIAPCDALIMEFGECKDNMAMQIKGKYYFVSDFIKTRLEEGYNYVNFYLSPSDYHRFHAPLNLKVKRLEFISGRLFSVSEKMLLKHEEVFVKNKRVVLECEDDFGNTLYFVAIGALNVGHIQINFVPEVVGFMESTTLNFDIPIFVQKGEEIGSFLMGSTIVLLSKNWKYDLKLKEKVYFGQCIAKFSKPTQEIVESKKTL
ncbi:phosphatidylserine decarboxylase [Helicobacter turcicus]|uniref:phosphatidylserine decarboxylase n=1 Tax=Helicobacter turcicus TaxID=2867412 RepID=A0ABS7JPG9_9HELI|nr:phosphatidylserine decarboxylase [Helicobacter turcicus]MBX7491305.1 phosphatidylserine decarboxylase [Helicobacter turcicus]MBX7546208.1 phosphatidylserine decarboxylase [Helicobacter turcicus]